MALPSSYNAQDAKLMMELGYMAGSDLSNLFLPSGWNLIRTFSGSFMSGGGQGYFATGALPSTGQTVAVMAVGALWPSLMANFGMKEHVLVNLNMDLRVDAELHALANLRGSLLALKAARSDNAEAARLAALRAELDAPLAAAGLDKGALDGLKGLLAQGGDAEADAARIDGIIDHCCQVFQGRRSAAAAAKIDMGFSLLYSGMASSLKEALNFTASLPEFKNGFPVVATGMNIGGPASQLAALNNRPGLDSPVTEIISYSFSNPPYGNAEYSAAFKLAIPGCWRVTGSVDLFPSQPTLADGYAPTGTEHELKLLQPLYSSPWLERSQPYYNTGYGAAMSPIEGGRSSGATAAALRTGYDPNLAHTMSLLVAVANQRFQSPGSVIRVNTSPFTFSQDILSTGITWAAAYSSGTNQVAVAFRDTATWLELLQVVNKPSLTAWTYGGDGRAFISAGLNTIYAGLRDDLRTWLATQPLAAKKVLFTGSGAGGALAAIAALDLHLNPLPGSQGIAGVYSFGGTPVGNARFMLMYDPALVGLSFMVNRPLDIMPSLPFAGGFQRLALNVPLDGGDFDPFNTVTYHPIYVYIQLLDPFGGQLWRMPSLQRKAPRRAPDQLGGFLRRVTGYHRVDWSKAVIGPVSTNPQRGPVEISWLVKDGALPPLAQVRNHKVYYGIEDMTIRKDAPLKLVSPFDEPLILILARLTMEAGAQIVIEGPCRLDIGQLLAPTDHPPAEILLLGVNGVDGTAGPEGATGSSGAPPNGAGGTGGSGGRGSDGSDGTKPPDSTFNIDYLDGLLIVAQYPGAGGAGGAGGRGGRGGQGGRDGSRMGPGGDGGRGANGGRGGDGGNGADVQVYIRELGPDARITTINETGKPGRGGQYGAGGIPGLGHPDGTPGAAGSTGPSGSRGLPGTIRIHKGGV